MLSNARSRGGRARCAVLASLVFCLVAVELSALQDEGLVRVSERTWVWISADETSANSTVFVGDEEALVVDPGVTPAIAARFLAAVAEVTERPVRRVVLTQWQPDHSLGILAGPALDVELIAHVNARRALVNRLAKRRDDIAAGLADPKVRAALLTATLRMLDTTLVEARVLDLGNHRVELRPCPPARTTGDLYVRSLDEGVVAMGDLFSRGSTSSMGAGNEQTWLAILDEILAFEPEVIVPGHGGPSHAEHLLQYRDTLAEAQGGLPPERGWQAGFSLLEKRARDDVPSTILLDESGAPTPSSTGEGRLSFAPHADEPACAVRDVWNATEKEPVPLSGWALATQVLDSRFACAVLVSDPSRVELINTASLQVVADFEVGADPVDLAASADERFLFVASSATPQVEVFDVAAMPAPRLVARLPLDASPLALALSPTDDRLWASCAGGEVAVIAIPPAAIEEQVAWSKADGTEVIVLGMIHGGHRTSTTWGLEQLGETIRRIDPDVVCTEIPPERWERAWDEFASTGVVLEPRVARFPEYVDCLFDLKVQMGIAIEPCAAWTTEMNDLRNARIAAFAAEFPQDQAAMEAEESALAVRFAQEAFDESNPRLLHSERYDARAKASLGPYDRYLNEWIGPGGWTNINAAHYALIDAAIARHRGERILVTFGSSHKYWILEQLRAREDLTLLEPLPFLPE